HRILVAGNPDHHGVKAFLHLVVGAQVQSGVAIAAPGRVAAPGPIEIVVDTLFAGGTDEVAGLDLAVQVEAIADAAGDLRLGPGGPRPRGHTSVSAAPLA